MESEVLQLDGRHSLIFVRLFVCFYVFFFVLGNRGCYNFMTLNPKA